MGEEQEERYDPQHQVERCRQMYMTTRGRVYMGPVEDDRLWNVS